MQTTTKKLLASVAVVGTIAAVALFNTSGESASQGTFLAESSNSEQKAVTAFNDFINKHSKNYLTKEEYRARLNIFQTNYNIILKNNEVNKDYKLDTNQFADLSDEEFQKRLGFRASQFDDDEDDELFRGEEQQNVENLKADPMPQSIDWRTQGAVSAIKNQGSCGGCYAFSSADAMEGAYALKNGQLQVFSPQQIIDCSTGYGNAGCGGGLMTNSFNYLKTAKIMTMSSYPYVGNQQQCRYSSSKGVVGVTSFVSVTKNSPSALKQAIQVQPVSIAVAAAGSTFRLYKSGIITSSACGTSLDHAVLLVGYGSQNGQSYWIVKNSWGTTWGESGYVRILDDGKNGAGICGMLQMSSYPKI
ncbi:UNKNOWN [Stylonychia lemnae]|uniref:Cysteine protease n=1 Tax=Stylonychia lemnae TaxID=5949 RepID=A0A077ZR29_STYLE|nr:UNKNOWN [Stylonychia lemnae]|eukprot:CDW72368.1 UNKNOWN [Stylonychia lemnae]